jgi:hypothetical protein
MTSDLQIYFDDSLTAEQRALVEESVVAIVESKRAQTAAALARTAELEKFELAINAPLIELIEQHPISARAVREAGAPSLESPVEFLKPEPAYAMRVCTIPVSPADRSIEVRVPPYDFHWAWRDLNGAEPHSIIGNRDGRLGMDARSGSGNGFANRFVSSHTGVGCLVRTDREVVFEFFARRANRHSFVVGARGVSANATSEGGLETTFMRGSQLLQGGTFPLFRRRVSAGEDRRDSTGWTEDTYPNGMGGRFGPGEYVFNAGIFTFTDFSTGVAGVAGAQSLVQSEILEMRIGRR